MKKNLALLLSFTMVFMMVGLFPHLEVKADDEPPTITLELTTKTKPEVVGQNVYANGFPIVIKEGTTDGYTTILWHKETSPGVYTDEEITGATNQNMSLWTIYGGTEGQNSDMLQNDYVTETKITMVSGYVNTIYGGGLYGKVQGSTNVAITSGTVSSVYGGGARTIATVDTANGIVLNGTANTDTFNNLLYKNSGGNLVVKGNAAVPVGVTLTILNGKTLTVPDDSTLTNNGTIINKGTIDGIISGNQPTTSDPVIPTPEPPTPTQTSSGSSSTDTTPSISSSDKVVESLKNAKKSESVTIYGEQGKTVSKDILKALKESKANLNIKCNGYTWTIDGSTVTDTDKNIDLTVTKKSSTLTGDVLGFKIGHDGDFPFEAKLKVELPGFIKEGTEVYLYKIVNGQRNFQSSAKTSGYSATFQRNSASEYVISTVKSADLSAGEGVYENVAPLQVAQNGIAFLIVSVLLATGIVIYKKKVNR